MAIMIIVGESWVRRSGRSPEFWDSWVITLWGIGEIFVYQRVTTTHLNESQYLH